MDSFVEVLNRVKELLEGDAALQAFCQEQWGKALTAAIVFRHRREINVKDLPLVLITRPEVRERRAERATEQGRHTVRLYCGFYQNDPAVAVSQQVAFEELIDDALTVDNPFRDIALEAALADSVNDEGSHHPTYFTLMDMTFLIRRARRG